MEGIIRQTNGTVIVLPATPGGLVNAQQLTKIAQLVTEGAGLAKFTTGQRVAIFTTEDKIESVRAGLAEVGLTVGPAGNTVRSVKACTGDFCQWALQDTLTHGIELDGRFSGLPLPFAFKIGVSGCGRNCMEVQSQDLGLAATLNGYNIYIGGKGGGKPVHGQLLAQDVPYEEVSGYIDHVIQVYNANAGPKERLNKVLARMGLEPFKLN